jgi:uncharacterized membrane protein YoaK (UPF0700 family)
MSDTSIHSDRPTEILRRFRHLLPGAAAMAAVAGYVNSVVLGFFHTPVSHMTGAVSRTGVDLAEHRGEVAANLMIIGGFLLGAVVAGLLVGAKKLTPNRRFGIALVLEGALLGLATFLLLHEHRLGLPAAALACGLQNAIGSSYCGLQIRTTHITGMVTDLGTMIGHWIRHRWVDRRKFLFFLGVFLAFGMGGYAGAVADGKYGPIALTLPAVAVFIAGVVYYLFVHMATAEMLPDAPPRIESHPLPTPSSDVPDGGA